MQQINRIMVLLAYALLLHILVLRESCFNMFLYNLKSEQDIRTIRLHLHKSILQLINFYIASIKHNRPALHISIKKIHRNLEYFTIYHDTSHQEPR